MMTAVFWDHDYSFKKEEEQNQPKVKTGHVDVVVPLVNVRYDPAWTWWYFSASSHLVLLFLLSLSLLSSINTTSNNRRLIKLMRMMVLRRVSGVFEKNTWFLYTINEKIQVLDIHS